MRDKAIKQDLSQLSHLILREKCGKLKIKRFWGGEKITWGPYQWIRIFRPSGEGELKSLEKFWDTHCEEFYLKKIGRDNWINRANEHQLGDPTEVRVHKFVINPTSTFFFLLCSATLASPWTKKVLGIVKLSSRQSQELGEGWGEGLLINRKDLQKWLIIDSSLRSCLSPYRLL